MKCKRCGLPIDPGIELTPEQKQAQMGSYCYEQFIKGIHLPGGRMLYTDIRIKNE